MKRTIVRIIQLLFAVTFVFSGLVKCIDPAGTAIKLTEYLLYWGWDALSDFSMGLSWLLCLLEFVCGINLLLGHGRTFALTMSTLMMIFFTPLTLWLAVSNAIQDCGCFGDAIHLSNWQTFGKNVVLDIMLVVLWCYRRYTYHLLGRTSYTLFIYWSFWLMVWLCWMGTWREPIVDFRPYHPGLNLRAATVGEETSDDSIDDDQRSGSQVEYTCIYERNGVRQEFALDNLPDEADGWEFVETVEHTMVQNTVGAENVDFFVKRLDGEVFTSELLADTSYTILLLSPSLDKASQHDIDRIEQLLEYAEDNEYPFYGVTARDTAQLSRWQYNTGAEYEFLFTDATIIETMTRSNPGIMLLHDGIICWKKTLSEVDAELLTSAKLNEQSYGEIEEIDSEKQFLFVLILLFGPFVLFLLFEIPQKLKNNKKDSKDA